MGHKSEYVVVQLLSSVWLFATPWTRLCKPTRLLCPWNFLGKNIGVGGHFLLQGVSPPQGWNPLVRHLNGWNRQCFYFLLWRKLKLITLIKLSKAWQLLNDSSSSLYGLSCVFPKFMWWSLKLELLRMWLHLETRLNEVIVVCWSQLLITIVVAGPAL